MSLMLVSTNHIMVAEVQNLDYEPIGTVQDMILDILTGRIVYLVIHFKPEMLLGDDEFPVPFPLFSYDREKKVFLLNYEREKFRYVKRYKKGQWPDISDVQWNFDTYLLYGYEPFWENY